MSSVDQSSKTDLGRRFGHLLPPRCLRFSSDYFVQSTASSFSETDLSLHDDEQGESSLITQTIPTVIETISSGTFVDINRHRNGNDAGGIVVLPAHTLSSASSAQPLGLSTLIDWNTNREEKLSARVSPVDSGKLFVDDKSYLLVGLTGDLGRSLCRWMVLHGAKYVVLTSRNPKIDPRWIAHVEDLGGNVTVLSMYVNFPIAPSQKQPPPPPGLFSLFLSFLSFFQSETASYCLTKCLNNLCDLGTLPMKPPWTLAWPSSGKT